jgi:hypothetical protein
LALTNETGFPATLARAQLFYRDLFLATVVVKAAFDVLDDGTVRAVPADAQLPVSEKDVTTDLGTLDGDIVPIKPGCDLALLGHARSPRADRGVDRLTLEIAVGRFRRSIAVFGDRAWVEGVRAPRITDPVPFTSIPLTYEHSYGGKARVRGKLEAPYAQNGTGRGHVRLREDVAGTRLPNLEEVDQLVTTWEQTPLSAGTAPLPRTSSLRLEGGGFGADLGQELVQLGPAAFSFAHPRMRLGRYPAGEAVTVTGATHGGRWTFRLPEATFTAAVSLGDARYFLPLAVDTLCLLPDYQRFFIVARRACVYQLLPQRTRSFAVFGGGLDPAATRATTTIAAERRAERPVVPIAPAAPPETLPFAFDDFLRLYPLTNIVEGLPLLPSS